MFFTPHILQILVKGDVYEDSKGNAIPTPNEWKCIGECRCDDAGNATLYGTDGTAYNPKFKIVTDKSFILEKGSHIRALREDGNIRGQGVVDRVTENNYLNYQTVWVT